MPLPPLNGKSFCPTKLSGIGGVHPSLSGKNPLSTFLKPPFLRIRLKRRSMNLGIAYVFFGGEGGVNSVNLADYYDLHMNPKS